MSALGAHFDFIKDEIRGAWRFRWIAMAIAWVVALGGWLVTCIMPNVFEARSRVYVETSTELRPLLQGLAIETDIQSQLDLVRQALLSTPTLSAVGEKAKVFPAGLSPLEREEAIERLRDEVSIAVEAATGTSNYLYTMSYRDQDREKSVIVVSSLMNSLINDVIGKKRSGQEDAQEFLQTQITDYEKRLTAAEDRLADFKKRNLGLVPGESGDYFSRLQTENEALEKARGDMRVAELKRSALLSQLRGESTYVPVADSPMSRNPPAAGAELDSTARLQQAEARLQELLLRYTEQHPEVIALNSTIAELKVRQKQELDALRAGNLDQTGGRSAYLNPVHQQIQMQLNQVNLEIATLRGQIADRERRGGALRRMADTAPEVEAEFARLNRDYGVTRAQYQSMVERLERARLSDRADENGSVKFSIIDPPVAKLEPVAPKRGLLVILSLVFGLAAGGGTAYLMHLTRPVFQNAKALAEATGLHVLGAVSLARPAEWAAQHRAETRRVAMAFSLLLAVCIVVLVSNDFVASLVNGLRTGS